MLQSSFLHHIEYSSEESIQNHQENRSNCKKITWYRYYDRYQSRATSGDPPPLKILTFNMGTNAFFSYSYTLVPIIINNSGLQFQPVHALYTPGAVAPIAPSSLVTFSKHCCANCLLSILNLVHLFH